MTKNMNSLFSPYIAHSGVVILDGALATELESRGADINDPLWSARLLIENPALIQQVHYDYLEAGADVIISASYQASFEGFARRGIAAGEAKALMQLSVELALAARRDFLRDRASRINPDPGTESPASPTAALAVPPPLVAASIGPYGAFLADGSEYRGNYGVSIEQLMDFHRPRLAVLAESGADLLACETIPCLDEGIALVRLLKEFPSVQAWISFSCKNPEQVCDGGAFADCAALAGESGQVAAVGINCTDPRFIESLVTIASAVTDKPVLTYPNKGETWDGLHKCWVPAVEPIDFGTTASQWYKAGALLIGGCCRTTPADIRQLVRQFSK
jgi:homocysteine S-methyltransferase